MSIFILQNKDNKFGVNLLCENIPLEAQRDQETTFKFYEYFYQYFLSVSPYHYHFINLYLFWGLQNHHGQWMQPWN